MWSEQQMVDFLKKNLKEGRFNHTLGVMETATILSKKYKCDEEKARISGLLHDCAKNLSHGEILQLVKDKGFDVDDVYRANPLLMHGIAGVIVARDEMGVYDEDILNAILYHTTGKKNMTLLEKIIYLADYIEPNRNFKGVEELRKVAFEDLDSALLMAFDNTIKFVIDGGDLLHQNTIEARNYLIFSKKRG